LIFCDEPTSDINQTPLVGKLVPALLDIPKEGPKDTTQQRAARKKTPIQITLQHQRDDCPDTRVVALGSSAPGAEERRKRSLPFE
jgi:hypothetical protein